MEISTDENNVILFLLRQQQSNVHTFGYVMHILYVPDKCKIPRENLTEQMKNFIFTIHVMLNITCALITFE